MTTFEDYFSSDCIIRELCKARVNLASRRHEALFFYNIDRSQSSPEEVPTAGWGEISIDIFPARRVWNRYRPQGRRGGYRDIHLETLLRAVRHLLRETPAAVWAKRLMETVVHIRERALSQTPFTFSAPTIVPRPKGPKEGRTYRRWRRFLFQTKSSTASLPDTFVRYSIRRCFLAPWATELAGTAGMMRWTSFWRRGNSTPIGACS